MNQPKKERLPVRFTGQHFIKDMTTIRQMIQEVSVKPGDLVLDIGAGKGAIIKELLTVTCRVIAIERDKSLANSLNSIFANQPNIKVLEMDFRKMPMPNQPFKVVANIPYAITTDIFGLLMDKPYTSFEQAVLILEWGGG
ncbi:MAG: methyltransferase domain-containing protein [Balneolaceae bacterium]|nr:methyltransferase domain-containing protein [Balneolaceae bacterium]